MSARRGLTALVLFNWIAPWYSASDHALNMRRWTATPDNLAGPGSHVAVEDGAPLSTDEFVAKVEEERTAIASGEEQRPFFQLVYNEQHAQATEWFDQRGWTAVGTPLTDYLREVGRPVPGPETEALPMIARITLVSAVKA